MGVGEQANLVHLIDFGLSKEFRNPKTHAHIPYKQGLGLTGTATFASINPYGRSMPSSKASFAGKYVRPDDGPSWGR